MVESRICQECGAPLPENAPEGLCPKCLMRVAMGESHAGVTQNNPARIDGPGTAIGRYELLELIGEGGMGLVYLAEQKEPVRRKVALKIIKPGMDSHQVIARFEAERQTLAVLDHPNIAHVFDAGCTEAGRPYFVMEHVKGMSITRYCDDKKLTIEQRLRLFEQVCEGVQHAHQKGIIHRDLKPSNILVTMQGDRPVPKIIDFGIAKATTQSLTDATVFTYQGQLLGTPDYMSPEQVDLATQDIDTRSDIYSLGIVLYELLAGVLPFESESFTKVGLAEIQRTIREDEPASPSIRLTQMGDKAKGIAASRGTQVVPLARRLHRELEWIPMKAMRKDRCRRYRSASELADDIRNYLNGLPLIAGPETAMYRVQKFARKHAGSVATVALVSLAIVLGLIVSTTMYFRAEDARKKEIAARAQAEEARVTAEQAREKEATARAQAEQAEETAAKRAEDYRRALYVNSIQLADVKYQEGNISRVRTLLDACPNDLRGWEWNRLNYISDQSIMTLHGHESTVYSVAITPDGKRIISGSADNTIRVWDAVNGAQVLTIPKAHKDEVTHVAVSPDGKRIASGDESGEIKVWDSADGRQLMMLKGHQDWVSSVTFSPDGNRIASGSFDGTAKLWDAATGNEIMTLHSHKGGVESVAFSPDGKQLVSAGGREPKVKVWDVSSGKQVLELDGGGPASYSPDGRLIVGTRGTDIRVWDATTGGERITLRGHDRPIDSLAFSADSRQIVSGSMDNTIRIWEVASGAEVLAFRGHYGSVSSVVFAPDGRCVISGSYDNKIKVWDTSTQRESVSLIGHDGLVCSISLSPNGNHLVSSGMDGKVKVWNIASGSEVLSFRGAGGGRNTAAVTFGANGKLIASPCVDGTIKLWDAETGAQVSTLRAPKAWPGSISFTSDGRWVASPCSGGTIGVWDTQTGRKVHSLGTNEGSMSLAFSPDGKRIVSGTGSGEVILWDVASGTKLRTLTGHARIITSVAFSPDGKRVISACQEDGTVKIWDAATGTEVLTFRGHGDIVLSVAFSPDGKRIISGSRDQTVRVSESTTGAELLTLRASSAVTSVSFSTDGKTIACGTFEGRVILWESTPPPGRYEARKNGAIAYRVVDEMYRTFGSYHETINNLQTQSGLADPVRKVGLQIANSRRWEDADKLTKEVWETVDSPNMDIEAYQTALAKAEKANGWEPNEPDILRTLGAAQYRTGSYEEAFKTLTRAEKLRADVGDEPEASDLAFTAMALHQLGRADDAKSTLEQLRVLLKDERYARDEESKAVLAEAEGLIMGEQR